ncbi:MBL fold metallo-hydrolase [Bordetella bronchiseptica]|nr:alkyl sulfatase dimerization domain-containing protein [Bordetella bronchiseptica]KDB69500.1 metallo-beta-lactamase domain protein [Bordetella bronchiseptica A1-7]KDC58516.1 metallo-beta-lactamase domain protein [Bordetella bronchiseptica MBORD595]KDC71928.1 metallo-beta-lactamase domain protein [Bordetella bronchiseptica MBORD624]KDC88824.1 metallo-beta-lactamase domain protein [Bordetella bronchiseptica MBORD665]KDC98227.1 metallo-beta-lactamase domain protein [Bordetella bronchiseptica M
MRFACSVQYPQNTSRHWRTMALRAHLAPVALALSTLALSNPAWSAQAPKPAEAATREANAALLKELPFSDKTSFELAHKGFVAPLPDAMIKGAQGNMVWDPTKYNFIKEGSEAPATVNPSLWRQSQLLNISGLFEVADGIYQVRNLDLSNMTIVEGKEGLTIMDPLISTETAKAALDLYYQHRPRKPVVAVIYTHSHVDHYGGVRGVVDEADVKAGKVKIYAPLGFLEHAVAENVMAGTAMSRRASYMYGNLLPPSPTGQVGAGLGTTTSAGTVTLIPPTDIIEKTGETRTIDGLTYEFLYAPGSEAPAEMLYYIKEKKALNTAEDSTHTLHNTYSLRGAKIRDPLAWSKYLNEALALWGDDVQVMYAMHHWPVWGNKEVGEQLSLQRDMYRYINDETLRLANMGYNKEEIAEQVKLPEAIATKFSNRGYYGSLNHNVRATYVLYLGWFNGNPATLHTLPIEEGAKRYVDMMGGTDALLKKAREYYAKGEYRWVAEVVNYAVFADPKNQAARDLQADALEQMGYQAESGPWRNFYLTGAKELREGVQKLPVPDTASPDTVRAMTLDMLFDYFAVRLNREKTAGKHVVLNLDFTDTNQKYILEMGNSVLNHTEGKQAKDPDASLSLARETLNDIMLKKTTLKDALAKGDAKLSGDQSKLNDVFGSLDDFEFWFNIVTP